MQQTDDDGEEEARITKTGVTQVQRGHYDTIEADQSGAGKKI